MNDEEGKAGNRVRFSKERLETLLFKEKKVRRAALKRKRNLAEKIEELNKRFATVVAEVSEHDRRVTMFEEEVKRNPSPVLTFED